MLRISQTLNDVDSKILSTLKKIESPLWDAYGYPTQTATSELAALTGLDPVDIYYSLKFIRSVNAYDEVSGLPNDPVFDPPLVAKLNDVLNAGGDTKQLASEKCLNLNDLPDPSWCEPSPIELTLNNALVECHRRDTETGTYDYRARLEFDPETGRLKQIPLETKTAYSRDEVLFVLTPLLDAYKQVAAPLKEELARIGKLSDPKEKEFDARVEKTQRSRRELEQLPDTGTYSHEKVLQIRLTLENEIKQMAQEYEVYRALPTSTKFLEENLRERKAKEMAMPATVLTASAMVSATASATASVDSSMDAMDVYPLWAWEGTAYADFAEVCGRGNYIPKEFLIEALKTAIGGAAGHLLGIERSDVEARFYTVLLANAGTGKSTALNWALKVLPSSLAYTHGDPLWPNLGCYVGSFGSQTGLIEKAKDHSQILQLYDEFSTLSDKFKIVGSGLSFLSLINALYEKTLPPSNVTKFFTEDLEKPLHNSILAATTFDVWERTFGGTGSEGSGFFQRLNIIASDESRTVARLITPDFSQFAPLVDRIKRLAEKPYKLPMTDATDRLLGEWFDRLRAQKDGVDVGRLQVLALRNAAHLGWLLDVQPDKLNETSPEEVIKRAIALGDYQLAMRRKYQPICGDSPWAQMENLLRRYVKQERIISRSQLYRKVNADRYGIKIFSAALDNLTKEGFIICEKVQTSRRPVEVVRWIADR